MESQSIPDSNITASSVRNASTPAKNGRLNFTSGSSWCAATSDTNPYLQIDLQTLHIICAVSTQGNSRADQWVKNYTLQSSTDGSTWTDYTEIGQVKSLKGNEDRNSEVKHILYEGVLARYLRFLPANHHGAVCMRTEVFGVKLKPENLALGRPTAQSTTYSSNIVGNCESGRAVDGNDDTDMRKLHCSQTKKIDNNPSWWRVDLGSDHVPVSEIHIVNRFTSSGALHFKDFKIALGNSTTVTSNTQCLGLYSFIRFKASAVCFTDPLKTGRYVGIMTTLIQALQLCEVEVYSRENLAFRKQTSQISTADGGASSRAVDGNSETTYSKGSCTLTQQETKPWWRVDLGQVKPVSEVYIVNRGDNLTDSLNNFEIRVGSTNIDGGVTNPQCGGTYSIPGGKGLSFFCRPPLYGRYVTIRSLRTDSLTICEVEVYSERRACPIQALGVASSDAFSDNSFSASSSSSGNGASKGRLNGDGAWSPSDDSDASDYLQIDLQYEFVVCAVATQGKSTSDHWTKEYKLHLSLTGNDWITYQENNVAKVFNGSSGRNDIVKHTLKVYASARFIRFQPTAYNGRKALRVEVFGILISAVPSQAPSALTATASTSISITASWQLPPDYARHGNITGFKLFYKKKDSAGSPTTLTLNDGASRSEDITNLKKYTEYEFQVLAFTSVGDGPRSSVVVERTKEDVPSQPPSSFSLTAKTSTSIEASWKLPPADSWNGIIKGFKLFYRKKGSSGSTTKIRIDGESNRAKVVSGLDEYTEYEFQVLAFTSAGNGPKSSVKVERTEEDAPGAPRSVSHIDVAPSKFHGPRINLTWSGPSKKNGIIRNYSMFYSHEGDIQKETFGSYVLSHIVDVLGGVTYQFHVRAVTIKPGPNASLTVNIPEYAPSRGPENVSFIELNYTTFQITWVGLPKEVANGIIEIYQVRLVLKESCTPDQSVFNSSFNTTTTDIFLSSLSICTRYEVSVRGYTVVGPGPYSKPMVIQTLGAKWPEETPTSLSVSTTSSEDGIKVRITLPRFPGNAKFFQVIVITYSSNFTGVVNPPESFTPQDLLTYEEAHQSPRPAAYIAFQFSGNDFDKYKELVVGDGAESNSKTRNKRSLDDDKNYFNKPLRQNTNYRVFLRAFVTETVYISSNFVEIESKDKPVIEELPERVILSVGELAVLMCEVSGDPGPSVAWTKNGNSSIPRAQFKNDGRILVIPQVLPGDSGVYECKASNAFGESRAATTLIVAVPPSIIEDVSPPSVICKQQTLCSLSCHATSDTPFNYSWTKNDQVPVGDDITIMNNSIVITPRDAKDYGVYVCHASNSFGSTPYRITLSEGDIHNDWRVTVIALSCIVFVLLVVICVLIWRLRRAVPNNRTKTSEKAITHDIGQPDLPRNQHVSEPGSYMELHPRPSEGQSRAPPDYQTLQGRHMTSGYYNVAFKKGNRDKQDEEVYAEIGNDQC